MSLIETILLSTILNFLMLGSVVGLVFGTILILQPNWLVRASLIANRWISTRHIDKFLENPVNIDSWYYRYRRTSALVTMAGAIYVLYFFGVQLDKASAISGVAQRFHLSTDYVGLLFDPMVLITLSGSAFALLVSLFVLFQPNMFRKFEHGANEWVSLRRTMKPLEVLRNNVDEYTFRHALQIGVMLVMGSVYTLVLITF